jgi:hypothetical protein
MAVAVRLYSRRRCTVSDFPPSYYLKNLSEADLRILAAGLNELPRKFSGELFDRIQRQILEQEQVWHTERAKNSGAS